MVVLSKLCCLRRLHPDLAARVSEITLRRYRKELDRFLVFIEDRLDAHIIETPEDLDDMIFHYRDDVALSRTRHITLIAAIEFHIPRWKGQLIDSKQAVKGRQRQDPTKHTVAFTLGIALLFACHIAHRDRPRLGAGLVIQVQTGLRPSELLAIVREDIRMAHDRSGKLVIRLGAFVGTKAKREQYIIIDPIEQSLAFDLLLLLYDYTSPGDLLIPYAYSQFRFTIREIDADLGLNLGVSAHSGRAAFATEGVAAGKDIAAIQSAGRWASEQSFRIYVDIIGAGAVTAHVKSQGLSEAILWCSANAREFFTAGAFENDIGKKKVSIGGSIGKRLTGARPKGQIEQVPASSTPRLLSSKGKGKVGGERSHPFSAWWQFAFGVGQPSTHAPKGRSLSKGKGKGQQA